VCSSETFGRRGPEIGLLSQFLKVYSGQGARGIARMSGGEYFLAPMSTALVALLLTVAAVLLVLVERRRTPHRFDVGQVSEGWLIARRAQDAVETEPRIRS
jgi:hypothetical protein